MTAEYTPNEEVALHITGQLMAGKRGLIMGVANDHSIAWGIAKVLHQHGAQLAFSYQGEALEKRIQPLASSVGSRILLPCDVTDDKSVVHLFEALKKEWGHIDFVVHAIAFADKQELKGSYINTSRENFLQAMNISCYSFTQVARLASEIMNKVGGSLLTLTYDGSQSVVPNYNVMGLAKAALESSVRYIANALGEQNIRVNAISAGPVRTLAGSAIGAAKFMYRWARCTSPLKKTVEIEHVGASALYLLSDLSARVTGEIHYVDCGYNIIGIPRAADITAAMNPE